MEALHEPIWRKAGIFEAIQASIYNIPKNPSLVLALVEKWCPETKSFIFPWGEATITLEDVIVLLGFSVLGSSVLVPLDSFSLEMRDVLEKLERGRVENRSKDGRVVPQSWISSFMNGDDDDEIEHEAFLTMWLSDYVFPDAWRRSISRNVLPIAVRLARGERVALAPAVLATLYRDLSRIHGFAKSDKKVKLESLLKLVQVWIWERFSSIRPEAREMRMGEPRIARWSVKEQRCEKKNGRLRFDGFEWRPYGKTIRNWCHPKFFVEEGKWLSVDESLDDEFVSFARCLRVAKLGGIGFVEDYYPNRVAMQFGLSQDLPGLVTYLSDFTEKEAWDDYNKSLDGKKLYVPSRLATTSVTARYQEWWLKSVSEFLSYEELAETNRDDDAFPKVPAKLKRCRKRREARAEKKKGKVGDRGGSSSREVTLSELFQKELAKGTSDHSRIKRCKRAREEDDDVNITIAEEDDDVNITIAEMVKPRKKTRGGVSESSLCEKLSSQDETVATQEIEQRSEEKCDDEVYVRFDVKKGIGKISDCGGSTSKEMPLSELFQELAKRTGEHLRNERCKQARAVDDDNITIAEMAKSGKNTKGDASESVEKRSRSKADNNDAGLVQKPASEDETVLPQGIEPRFEVNDEEDETGMETEKIAVVISSEENNSSSEENNSSDLPPLVASVGGIVEMVVSPKETRQNCDDMADLEKETKIDDGTKEEECLVHENGENQRDDSGLCQKLASEDETVAPQDTEQKSKEKDEVARNKAEKITFLIPSDRNNSSEPSHVVSKEGIVETVVSTRQNCDDKADANGSNTAKKTMIDDGTKEEECLIHENGENQREKLCSKAKKEEEELDERLRQRKLAIEEIAFKLDARMMKVEKSLTKIRIWKTRGNKIKQEVSA
ncbi:hypothetical protein AALP_AA4G044500 [Arabis alpina]|uniref:Aminotransferase-like plant mobile domain-containing protein n=1 Tax=Arabis alpina TaxID=50452 RepID=A0A087H144_ARAAL|nr:hypothetical protein AALP_AA4G044500 [Arabis alpina]